MKLENKLTFVKDSNAKNIQAIRLFYVAMEKFKSYSTNEMCVGHTYGISSPFILPENITLEEASKVVSYITEKIEKENNMLTCSEKTVALVSGELEKYGFQIVDGCEKGHFHAVDSFDLFRRIRSALPVCQRIAGVVDLFTVSGDVRIFERSDLNFRYFDWYTPKVSRQEVEGIYKRIGKEHILSGVESGQGEME